MHLTQWRCQFCVMMLAGRMVFHDAQTAGRHSEPLALTFLSPDTSAALYELDFDPSLGTAAERAVKRKVGQGRFNICNSPTSCDQVHHCDFLSMPSCQCITLTTQVAPKVSQVFAGLLSLFVGVGRNRDGITVFVW